MSRHAGRFRAINRSAIEHNVGSRVFMDVAQFSAAYGPQIALALYFLYKEVWPWIRDKVFPEYAARKAEESKALAKALDAHRIAAAERENRLFLVIEQSISALTRIEGTLVGVQNAQEQFAERFTDELARHADVLHAVNLDVAGLYGQLGTGRPSRRMSDRIKKEEM